MAKTEFVFLKEDIHSIKTGKSKSVVYGKKGDLVKVIADSTNVLIVEGKNGERFSVRTASTTLDNVKPAVAPVQVEKKVLVQTPVVFEESEINTKKTNVIPTPVKPAVAQPKKKKKNEHPPQGTLF